MRGFDEESGNNDNQIRYVTVLFKVVGFHPCFLFGRVVDQGGVSYSDGGCCVDVELDVTGVAMQVETMTTDDFTKREHVENKQERTQS